MSDRKSITGKQTPKVDPLAKKPAASPSPLQNVVGVRGAGQTWFNLSRRDVEEKLEKQRQQQTATKESPSLWQRLMSAFRKSG